MLGFFRTSFYNNGGFAGVRFATHITDIHPKRIQIDLTGDSKAYQFRIKHKPPIPTLTFLVLQHQAVGSFEFRFRWIYGEYRGKDLNIPPFAETNIGEIGFLIAAKINEEFRLQIPV